MPLKKNAKAGKKPAHVCPKCGGILQSRVPITGGLGSNSLQTIGSYPILEPDFRTFVCVFCDYQTAGWRV